MPRMFAPTGQALAIDPRAFGVMVVEPPAARVPRILDGGVAVIDIHGALAHHVDPCADSYDEIKARVESAIEQGARRVVLAIDSPGGLVSGAFDTATEIRALCDDRGVELVAYVDGCTASAAYALACVASRIYVPPAGVVGSIGVIDTIVDTTRQNAAMGLAFTLVASGARKADGNPLAATTDPAVAAIQKRVDSLAVVFFDHVAQFRGISAEAVRSLEAATFVGGEAIAVGLADEIASLDQVVALVRTGASATAASAVVSNGENNMDEKEIRAALRAILENEESDAAAKARAKSALEALGPEEGNEDEKPEPSAEGDDEGEPEKKHEPEDASALAAVAALAGSNGTLEARVKGLEAVLEGERRSALRKSRPDVSTDVHAALAMLPLGEYEKALAKIERKPARVAPAAVVTPKATIGGAPGGGLPGRLAPEAKAQLDKAMGLSSTEYGVVDAPFKQTFGAPKAPAKKVG